MGGAEDGREKEGERERGRKLGALGVRFLSC